VHDDETGVGSDDRDHFEDVAGGVGPEKSTRSGSSPMRSDTRAWSMAWSMARGLIGDAVLAG
jgi:hypothetical protein